MSQNPVVSVVMITYAHENYIREAIEGVLMQECYFDVELIVANDFSPDKTDLIIKDIIQNHPRGNWIKYHPHEKNLGMMPNFIFALQQAKGNYIALCEGDDYWTDPFKLQKQVDFLEQNADYGLVHSDVNSYHQINEELKYNSNKSTSNVNEAVTKEELFNRLINGDYVIRTATVMFRTEYLGLIKSHKIFLMGDTPLWLSISQVTKFKYFDEVFATYRILTESASKSKDKKKLDRFRLSIVEMQIYYLLKFNYHIRPLILERYNRNLLNYLLLHDQKYEPLYPLFNPTLFDKLRLRYNDSCLFRILVKKTFTFERILKESLRNLKSVK